MPYTDAQHFNGQAPPNNEAYPPVGKLGGIFLMTPRADFPSNRMGYWINKYATAAELADGACRDPHEFWLRKVDPVTTWLEGTATPTSALIQFDRWGGNPNDNRKNWQPDEPQKARKFGKRWLVDGFLESAANYVDSGRQVVIHLGGMDSAHFSREYINAGRGHKLLKIIKDVYGPLAERGIWPGIDGASGSPQASMDWLTSTLLSTLGIPHQIESTPPLSATHWKGKPCYLAYALFLDRHITQSIAGFAKFGTPQFAEWHPDCRVALWADAPFVATKRLWGSDAEKKAILTEIAAVSKMLTKGGCRVLLDEPMIRAAISVKKPVGDFLN